MPKIRQLPADIIAQIAAGEVIERPSFAVKELIENSLDSKAGTIEIQIEEAGLKKIRVMDNGEGMTKDDLALCFLPHTTSKLLDDQLLGIKTLGFRGEALSSLAAIGKLTIQSRTEEKAGGNLIVITNNFPGEITPVGMPKGTIITIENLFSSLPARKKFLASAQTELRHITEIIMQYALSYSSVHFIFTHNAKKLLDIPAQDGLSERVKRVFGVSLIDQLIPISYTEGYLTISGFIGKPQIAGKNNQKQFIFVNNRLITDKLISQAVKEAFGTLLPALNTPVFFLSITVPHEVVDVNIHPRKEKIAFLNPDFIFSEIKTAVLELLKENNLTFQLSKFKQGESARLGETSSFAGQLLRDTVRETEDDKKPIFTQVARTYIFCSRPKEVMVVDQHAAHERILYEKFISEFENTQTTKAQYDLPKPLSLQLSLSDHMLLDEYRGELQQLGFQLEPFQGESYVIRSVPLTYKGRNIEKLLRELLSDLQTNASLPTIDYRSQRMLAFLACRSAVQAGDSLTSEQMEKIVADLMQTKNRATCPHGRPTHFVLMPTDLDREFRRK